MLALPRRVHCGAALVLAIVVAPTVRAQTDYYNLDAGRPLRVEDALVIERHAFEWQLAPLRLSGARGTRSVLGAEPELAWGILPRTQVELGVPILFPRGGKVGAAGVELTALHALNAETTQWPGLAVRVGVHAPAGPYGPRSTRTELGALATRTMAHGRLHANVAVHGGDAAGDPDASRWSAGLAADRAFVVQSFLIGAEVVAEAPTVAGADLRWSTAIGLRVQVDPRTALDLGVGRDLGAGEGWFITMGSARSFGLLHRFGGVR
jgi:hypothetical protein